MKETVKRKGENVVERGEYLLKLASVATQFGYPFTIFRLPNNQDQYTFQLSLDPIQLLDDVQLEEMEKGFIFSKFHGEKYYLRADLSWTSSDNELAIRETLSDNPNLSELLAALEQPETAASLNLYKKDPGSTEKTDQKFLDLVSDCIRQIEQGHFEKAVPARSHLVDGLDDISCVRAFEVLAQSYSNAFVSIFSSPETGTWLGATPELLVQTKNNKYFSTASLAGTQPYKGQDLPMVAWTQKEIEEQALVSRYIINCFKKIRLREFEEYGPKSVIAGNLLHLKTVFTVDMEETNFPLLGSVMLDLLHPTSAVCGMPLESSRDYLLKEEQLDRRFYSGYLGPVNVDDRIDLFVNLRCLEMTTKGAKLYAGAGVTVDSIPEKELEETELKFDTLRKIIFKQ